MTKNYLLSKQRFAFLLLAALLGVLKTKAQVTQTLSFTGSMQTFTVPSCVSSITFDVRGAEGGDAIGTTVGFGAGSMSVTGGDGGRVIATLTVTPGEVLNVFVGGKGSSTLGGFNGGGDPASCSGTEVLAGGGGGASDVRRAGVAFNNRIIVAGGGGGAAGAAPAGYQSVPGSGGGLVALAGTGGTGACLLGGGGTQSAGGAGGTNIGCSCNLTNVAGSGSLGLGGASICAPSGLSTCANPCSGVGCSTGGGGGGGYYGGGAGVARASAGGGSSYVEPTATSVTHTQGFQTGNGVIIVTYNFNGAVLSTTATPSAICTGGTATLSAGGLLSYTWAPGGSNASSITVSPTSNTTYTVQGTNALGCISTGLIPINVNSAVPVLTVSTTTTSVCPNNTVALTASGALSYTWTNGVTNGTAFTPAATNVYTVTGSNGCGPTTATIGVTVTPLPITVSATSTLICSATAATLTAGGATSYTWLPGTGTASNYIVTPSANTSYTVTGKTGSCSGTNVININTKPLPTLSILVNDSTLCNGETAQLTVSGDAITYTWNPGGPGASISVTPTNTSIYSVTGTNSVGCIRTISKIIAVYQNPVVNVFASTTDVCAGGSSTLTASGANVYSWAGGSVSSYVVNPTQTETFSVTGTNTMTGCSAENAVTVNVFLPTISVTGSSFYVCIGSNAVLTASGAVSYTWANNSSTSQNIQVTPTVNTTYTVSGDVVDLQSGLSCPATTTIDVLAFALPVITASSSQSAICRGNSASLTASGAGATGSYTWTAGLGTNPAITVAPILDQVYTVNGTDANNCKGTGTVQVLVSPCTGIENLKADVAKLSVYPNPNTGEFTVTSDQPINLLLINEQGQEIKKISLKSGSQKVMVNNIANGIYFMVGANENGSVKEKIIVTK